jgi:hypothetical protein
MKQYPLRSLPVISFSGGGAWRSSEGVFTWSVILFCFSPCTFVWNS